MKLKIGIEQVGENYCKVLAKDLEQYAKCVITRDGADVIVETEGDIVVCSCVIAICERYRFSSFPTI